MELESKGKEGKRGPKRPRRIGEVKSMRIESWLETTQSSSEECWSNEEMGRV